MAHLLTLHMVASETALEYTFKELSEVRFELENPITGPSEQQWPCLCVSGHSKAEIESALDDDPSVNGFENVSSREDAYLYDLDLSDDGEQLQDIIQEENGTILVASGTQGYWELTVCLPTQDDLSRLSDRLKNQGITPRVKEIRDLEAATELTETHREAVETALEHGYFQIPREGDLEDLAKEMRISEQVVSQRLRREYDNLTQTEDEES